MQQKIIAIYCHIGIFFWEVEYGYNENFKDLSRKSWHFLMKFLCYRQSFLRHILESEAGTKCYFWKPILICRLSTTEPTKFSYRVIDTTGVIRKSFKKLTLVNKNLVLFLHYFRYDKLANKGKNSNLRKNTNSVSHGQCLRVPETTTFKRTLTKLEYSSPKCLINWGVWVQFSPKFKNYNRLKILNLLRAPKASKM